MSYYYGQLNQPLTAEQIADQESMNRVAQVLGKSTAMAHTQLLDVQLREAQKARAQELARIQEICGMPGDERYEARTKAAEQAYNSAWPWPVSVKEVALEHNALVKRLRENAGAEPKPEAQPFDAEAHRTFMRGLG